MSLQPISYGDEPGFEPDAPPVTQPVLQAIRSCWLSKA